MPDPTDREIARDAWAEMLASIDATRAAAWVVPVTHTTNPGTDTVTNQNDDSGVHAVAPGYVRMGGVDVPCRSRALSGVAEGSRALVRTPPMEVRGVG